MRKATRNAPDFYRATVCVGAVLAVGQCLSVRLSVTLVYCIETAEYVKLLSHPESTIILVFGARLVLPILMGTPLRGH